MINTNYKTKYNYQTAILHIHVAIQQNNQPHSVCSGEKPQKYKWKVKLSNYL